jgi:hypothetical protein
MQFPMATVKKNALYLTTREIHSIIIIQRVIEMR